MCVEHGGPIEECQDPDRVWFPQRIVCKATMNARGAQNLYALLHDEKQYHDGTFSSWSKDCSTSHPYRFDDGVRIIATPTDLNPDDNFLDAGGR